jgi:predicted aspartyl protease
VFLIVTAAADNTIDEALAAELGLAITESRRVKVRDAAGNLRSARFTTAPRFAMGDLEATDVPFRVTHAYAEGLDAQGGGVQVVRGLIGIRFLEAFAITIDRPRGVLVLDARPAGTTDEQSACPCTRTVVDLERDAASGRFAVAATAVAGPTRAPLRLFVHTGQERSAIATGAATRAGLAVRPPAVTGAPASLVLDAVDVGDIKIEGVVAVALEGWTEARYAGHLGMDVLGRYRSVLDFPRKQVVVERPIVEPAAEPGGLPGCHRWDGATLEPAPDACFTPRLHAVDAETLVLDLVPEATIAGGADVALDLEGPDGGSLLQHWRMGFSLPRVYQGRGVTFVLGRRDAARADRGAARFPFAEVRRLVVGGVSAGPRRGLKGTCLWIGAAAEEGGAMLHSQCHDVE